MQASVKPSLVNGWWIKYFRFLIKERKTRKYWSSKKIYPE